jgi:methyl-accepting chemotaxis protein
MRFTIKLKLVLAFGLLIVLMTASTLFGINALNKLNTAQTAMIKGPMAQLQLAQASNIALLQITRAQKNMGLASDQEELTSQNAKAEKQREAVQTIITEGTAKADSAEAKAKWTGLQQDWEGYAAIDLKMRTAMMSGHRAEGVAMMSTVQRPLTNAVTKRVEELVAYNTAELSAADEAGNKTFETARDFLIAVIVGSLVLACGAAAWISLTISKGLTKVASLANAVALGDLAQRVEVTSNDEIKDLVDTVNRMTENLRATAAIADKVADGDLTVEAKPLSDRDALGIALQRMIERLRGVVADAISASENVSAGSQELSATSEQMSQGATEQASAAEQASASMEEMASNIKQNADNASQTEKIARQSAIDAETSGEAVKQGRRRHADDRREDHHRPGDRSPDRPAGPERGGGSRPGRRARPRLRGRRFGSPQAGRTQPDRRRRDQRGVVGHRQGRPVGRRDADQPGAQHPQDRRAGRRDQRRLPRAGHRLLADQRSHPATGQGHPAERVGVREMSATSEELAAQAEELQPRSPTSACRTNRPASRPRSCVWPRRAPPSRPPAVPRRARSQRVALSALSKPGPRASPST